MGDPAGRSSWAPNAGLSVFMEGRRDLTHTGEVYEDGGRDWGHVVPKESWQHQTVEEGRMDPIGSLPHLDFGPGLLFLDF